jgi:acyl-CoA synthetase (AMP-forming)/AMP-acid ligase II
MNYKCWIGKSGYFSQEVQQLILLLNESNNIILSTEDVSDFDWIADANPCLEHDKFPNYNGNIALQTSGTTGVPKLVWKNLYDIIQNKKGKGSNQDVWLLTYNPARWAGLSVIAHVLKTKAKLIVPDSLTVTNMLEKINQVTHISLTPSLFRKMLIADYSKLQKANIKQLTFGGEYANQKILNDAKLLYPNAKITHVYATTEAGDLCSCSDGMEGFPEERMPRLENGDMWKIENGRAYFIGRYTEVINIGGAKITQTEIENVVSSIPQIAQCKAFPISNALLGQVVGLDYIGAIDPKDVKLALLQKLPKYAVPVQIKQVDFIELTSANKMKR